jgi:carbon-monoxide dehydrogenase large subunit
MPINTGTESATIEMDATGAIQAAFGVASHGQGLETSLAQIVAEEMGAKVEDVQIIHGDSDATAHGTGTYASRSTVLAGGAGTIAAHAVKKKITLAAAHLLEVSKEQIDVDDGRVIVKNSNRSLSFQELAKAFYSSMGTFPKELREEIGNLAASKVYDPFLGTTTTASHITLIEIDPETYKVEILKYVVAEDCGRVINPMIVDGQVHGGVAQGIGAALYEEIVYDPEGQILTANLIDYLVPTAPEIPTIDVIHIENIKPATIGGYRGMGEGGTIGAPAAIANAIADALSHLDVNITELPATPERLFLLVQAAKEKKQEKNHGS